MSIETWKKEYYPKPPTKRMSKKNAIKHSVRKWNGLEKKILKEHGLLQIGAWIEERDNPIEDIAIDDETCALCVKFMNQSAFDQECVSCPLFQTLGKRCDNGKDSPYSVWRKTGNPRPMIRALKATLEKNS